ncbi:hypothetical protein BC830DRAFT_567360 [Chytriomyces sp. MP71]|nr:hypothetical protein BC830DRAFT_567360 [Chytriomyces sp. MP71]
MAKQQIENGADVLFGAAGTIGDGGIYYAASQKLWVIGVDQDESKTFFTNKSDPASQYIIGSAVFDAQHAVQEAVSEFIKGTPYSGNKVFDVTNGGVRFADCASAITCERMNQTFTFIDTSTANVNIQSLSVKDLLKLITTRMKVGSLVLPSVANGALQPYLLNNGSWEQLLTFGHRPVQLYVSGDTECHFLSNTSLFQVA